MVLGEITCVIEMEQGLNKAENAVTPLNTLTLSHAEKKDRLVLY